MKEQVFQYGEPTYKLVMKLCSYDYKGAPVVEYEYELTDTDEELNDASNMFAGWCEEVYLVKERKAELEMEKVNGKEEEK